MRVLILSWEYPPIVEGGLARHVHKIATQMASMGHDVHVLTRGAHDRVSGRAPDSVVNGEPTIHRVPEPERPAEVDAFIEWIGRMNEDMVGRGLALIADQPFDVIHAHDWLVASAADRLSRHSRVPMVTTIHATEHGRHQGWVGHHPQSHIHAIETWMARRSDAVITCSDYMRGHVADVFRRDEQRIAVIPNGIDPGDLRPAGDLTTFRAQFAAPDEQLVVLVGRLVYEKGFQHALEALAGPDGVVSRVGRVRFVVAGSGTHEQELRAQATASGLDEHGSFLGWIDDGQLHALYRVADLCVVPSIYEPFGLVALEAMASGCPCIVADSGGLREVVPDTLIGMRFPARDVTALTDSMVRLLTDDEFRRDVIARSAEHIERFDWTEIARETVEVYAETIERQGTAQPAPASR